MMAQLQKAYSILLPSFLTFFNNILFFDGFIASQFCFSLSFFNYLISFPMQLSAADHVTNCYKLQLTMLQTEFCYTLQNYLQDCQEMICCKLNQTIFLLCNHFYELNLHQFCKDQQFLANHLMISTCLKMIHFHIISFAILSNIRQHVFEFQ